MHAKLHWHALRSVQRARCTGLHQRRQKLPPMRLGVTSSTHLGTTGQ